MLQVLEDHLLVRLGDQLGVLEQRLDLAGEEQAAGLRRARVVERLDAEVVAVQHELAAAPVLPGAAQVGDGERPHAVEARGAGGAPLLVGVDDDLAVAVRAEGVAGGLELGAQLAVVVDLAVVDEPDGLVLVGHRLVPALAVDDAQAAVAEADGRRLEGAGVVGAAMHDGGGHAPEKLPVGRAGEAEDAAHERKLSWGLGPLTARRPCRAPRRSTLPPVSRPRASRAGGREASPGAGRWPAAPPQAGRPLPGAWVTSASSGSPGGTCSSRRARPAGTRRPRGRRRRAARAWSRGSSSRCWRTTGGAARHVPASPGPGILANAGQVRQRSMLSWSICPPRA